MGLFLLGVFGKEMWDRGIHKAESEFTRVVGKAPEVPSGELMSIELERFSTLEGAVALNPPGWKPLVENWNDPGGHRFDIPGSSVSAVPAAVYVPQARAGYEDDFGDLLQRGMDDVDLYVIDVPTSWSSDQLQDQIYKWAAWCRVNHEWISIWSAFRTRRFTRPQSECHPGGRCLIVSTSCDRRIHTAVDMEY